MPALVENAHIKSVPFLLGFDNPYREIALSHVLPIILTLASMEKCIYRRLQDRKIVESAT